MSKLETFRRYTIILNKIRKKPCSRQEIENALNADLQFGEYQLNRSHSTLKRDFQDIYKLFGVDIAYDFKDSVYRIQSDINSSCQNLIAAFDLLYVMKISNQMQQYIAFENRGAEGTQFLADLIEAVRKRKTVSLKHQKYWEDNPTQRIVDPLALKESRYRWYLVAKDCGDKKIKTFALDRIIQADITSSKFNYPKDFDVNTYFKYYFGVISPEEYEEPEEIVLSFDAGQSKYLKSLPLHTSQEIINENEDEFRISLKVYVTFDFIKEILSYGNSVQIIKSAKLKKAIQQER